MLGAVYVQDVPGEADGEEQGEPDVSTQLCHLALPLAPQIARHSRVPGCSVLLTGPPFSSIKMKEG